MDERRTPYHLGLVRDAIGQAGLAGGAKLEEGLRVGAVDVPAGAGELWLENSIRFSTALAGIATGGPYSLPSGVAWQTIPLGTEVLDTDNLVDLASSTTTLTVRTGGVYSFMGYVNYNANASGLRGVGVMVNGVLIAGVLQPALSGYAMPVHVAGLWVCKESEVFQLVGFQNTGANLTVSEFRLAVARIA